MLVGLVSNIETTGEGGGRGDAHPPLHSPLLKAEALFLGKGVPRPLSAFNGDARQQ